MSVAIVVHRGVATALIPLCVLVSLAQQKKEIGYHVGDRAVLSITNNYGPTTIKPSARAGEVLVTMILHSKSVRFEGQQHGNRVQLRAVSLVEGANLAEFTIMIPNDACVTLRSSGGVLRAEELYGDLIFESTTGAIELKNIRDSHIHVHALSGPATLVRIRNSHIDVTSVSGDINLRDISASSAVVHSDSGRIAYEGDPGTGGDYRLTTHSGNVNVSIPATSPVIISSRSESVQSRLNSSQIGRSGPRDNEMLSSRSQVSKGSVFVLRSLRGKISVLRPQ